MFLSDELARTIMREREVEARRACRHTAPRRRSGSPLRSRLARALVLLALRLDGSAGPATAPALTLRGRPKSSRV